MNEEAAEAYSEPGDRGRDPMMEEHCQDVNRAEAEELEQRMQRQREAGELVFLSGRDNQVLACSRYWRRLGE